MLDKILEVKLEKLEQIKQSGADPYPEKTDRTHFNQEALDQYDALQGQKITLVGRVRSFRPMGGSAFSHIEDGSARIQLFLNKKNVPEEKFKLFTGTVELGDFIEVTGTLFKTKTEERTLEVNDWKMLSKGISPIPTEFFGLKDEEMLLRKRYLDLMMNPETRELFRKKNIFWQTIRQFLVKEGFLEVQTPVLEHVPGGAEAEPFVTHYNALDEDFYLRISLELPLKRLLVGGYERVFEIGRVFRNEGMDRDHLQEFDHMEFYWAYSNLTKGMELTERMYKEVVKNVLGSYTHEYEGKKIDWEAKWPVVDYFSAFQKETGIDLSGEVSIENLQAKADELKVKYEKTAGKGRLIDLIYKKTVRQKLIQPCFLVGHPIEVSPLAKKDPTTPNKVLRFQVVAGRSELCNAFAELNDSLDQRARFEAQMKMREAGDKEAQMLDEDFLEALEYGMPPAFGFGLSERFFAFLMNKSVRETTIFPPVKEVTSKAGKSKETKMAVAVINKGAGMEPWQEMNTIAHLNASFAAREGSVLFFQDTIATKDDEKIKLNIQHAIMIKSAESNSNLLALVEAAADKKVSIVGFTREMIESTNDKKVIEWTSKKKMAEVEFLGVLIFGEKTLVEKMTADLELYK